VGDCGSATVSVYFSGTSVTLKLLGLRARGASILEVVDSSSINFCNKNRAGQARSQLVMR
jgi:hypothetical protein